MSWARKRMRRNMPVDARKGRARGGSKRRKRPWIDPINVIDRCANCGAKRCWRSECPEPKKAGALQAILGGDAAE